MWQGFCQLLMLDEWVGVLAAKSAGGCDGGNVEKVRMWNRKTASFGAGGFFTNESVVTRIALLGGTGEGRPSPTQAIHPRTCVAYCGSVFAIQRERGISR